MKKTLISILIIAASAQVLTAQVGQAVTFSYTLDTVHRGANMRVDSFYLIETTTGDLVQTGVPIRGAGQRAQSFQNPVFFSDTLQLTAYYLQLKNDSITLMHRAAAIQAQAVIAGAKYRAVQYLADSVLYGHTGGSRQVVAPPREDTLHGGHAPEKAPTEKARATQKKKAVVPKKKKQ